MKKNIIDIEKNNTEFHLPFYHFCGPGTKVVTRLVSNSNYGKPINELDKACMIHDIEYLKYAGNNYLLRKADEKLKKAAQKIGGMSGNLIDKVFFFKELAEDVGLWSPSSFVQMLVKNLSIPEQNLLGAILYEKYVNKNNDINIEDYFSIKK